MSDPTPEARTSLRNREILSMVGRFAWPAAVVAIAAMGFSFARDRANAPAPTTVEVAHAGPTVVKDLQALARLETLSLHMEKVLDVKDRQQRLHGLVEVDDAVLCVASGEVVLGVDLAKVRDEDARFDPATRTATITLPEPEILSARFDEARSYVHGRSTDFFAKRNESLEGRARKEAIDAFQTAAREPANLQKARDHAEVAVRAFATRWGATKVVVTWQTPRGERTAG